MGERRLSIIVQGRVQGVGFRFFTNNCAHKYNCTGWVRNCSDGSVAIEAQGTESALDAFQEAVNKGPALAHVHEMQVVELPIVESERGFEVRY